MAEYTNEIRNGRVRTILKLNPGQRVKICRCYHSKEFPFCDGAHNTIETDKGPAVVDCILPEVNSSGHES